MAKTYGLSEPSEYADANSWQFKRWLDELMELLLSQILLVTVTATYTVGASVYYVRADATSGAFTVTLPAALNQQGRKILIKKIDSSGNAVTIGRTGTDTIEGSATKSLSSQWDRYEVISNGVDAWEIV